MSRLTVHRLAPVVLMAVLFAICAPLVAPAGVAHAAAAATHAPAVSQSAAGAVGVGAASFFGKLFGGLRFFIVIVISIPSTIFYPWPPLL